MVVETIPLPRTPIQNRETFTRTVENVTAWPDQTFRVWFNYNDQMERWIWRMEHVDADRVLFNGPCVANLGVNYSAWPYMLAQFIAPQSDPSAVTPANLGDTVKLAVYPGPAGGHFPEEADITREEEDEILNRDSVEFHTP